MSMPKQWRLMITSGTNMLIEFGEAIIIWNWQSSNSTK